MAAGARISRRRLLAGAGTGIAGAAVAGTAWRGLGSAQPARPRNVVLIVIDSLRADHLGCYGNATVRTPAIDRLAAGSVRFSRVFPEALPTVPGRRSILTGRRVFPFTDWQPWFGMAKRPGWAPIMPGEPTLIDDMRAAGYWTSYVSDNPFLTSSRNFAAFRATPHRYVQVPGQRGERKPAATVPRAEAVRRLPQSMRQESEIRGVQRYLANNGRGVDDSQSAAARVFKAGAAELERAPRGRPFFMVVDSFDPHEPWATPREYVDLYGDPSYDGPEIATLRYRRSDYLSDDEIERVRAIYKGSVTMVDRWLGHFLDRLRRLDLEGSTVIALVSDHGILLGEHDWLGKGDFRLHPELIHVPLLLRDPDGRGAGAESDWFADTIDLAPTLMSLAGAEPTPRLQGLDLAPILDGDEPSEARPFTYGGYGNYCFSVDDEWKLIAANDGSARKLYDLTADPHELDDVAAAQPAVATRLYDRIMAEIGGRPPSYGEDALAAEPRLLPGA